MKIFELLVVSTLIGCATDPVTSEKQQSLCTIEDQMNGYCTGPFSRVTNAVAAESAAQGITADRWDIYCDSEISFCSAEWIYDDDLLEVSIRCTAGSCRIFDCYLNGIMWHCDPR